MINKYRKKPVVIEARQWPGIAMPSPTGMGDAVDRMMAFEDWLKPHAKKAKRWPFKYRGDKLIIPTLEGDMQASQGDWIIVGVQGEIYPCKPDVFDATYEPAEGTTNA